MVILFDGVCNFCNGFVSFIIRHDKRSRFKFAALQSGYGRKLIEYFSIPGYSMETVLLYDNKKIFTRSEAVIRILTSLGGIWKLMGIVRIIPYFILNIVYNFISKRRYFIFGKRESCLVPSPEINSRFLDNSPFIFPA